MITLHLKDWLHEAHMPHVGMPRLPDRHEMVLRWEEITRKEEFWPLVIVTAVMAAMVVLLILAIMHPEWGRNVTLPDTLMGP